MLALLLRSVEDIRSIAERLLPRIADLFDRVATVQVADCQSQIGSGRFRRARSQARDFQCVRVRDEEQVQRFTQSPRHFADYLFR